MPVDAMHRGCHKVHPGSLFAADIVPRLPSYPPGPTGSHSCPRLSAEVPQPPVLVIWHRSVEWMKRAQIGPVICEPVGIGHEEVQVTIHVDASDGHLRAQTSQRVGADWQGQWNVRRKLKVKIHRPIGYVKSPWAIITWLV
mmetsp:Transcript_75619/g.133614  ORF Transcript_75619/g.133614 Transcript_75619/m.133614 type:complete len:141 (+) Transcript_75619:1086-1508(+)